MLKKVATSHFEFNKCIYREALTFTLHLLFTKFLTDLSKKKLMGIKYMNTKGWTFYKQNKDAG